MPYTDTSSSYAAGEIADLYTKGIMNGTEADLFSPKKPMTRAEFVTVLVRLLRLQPVQAQVSPFKDMKAADWYYPSVMAAFQLQLTTGTSGEAFTPSRTITREEAAQLLVRALKQAASASAAVPYTDAAKISSWAKAAVAKASALGLIKGDEGGSFRPGEAMTREEAAVMFDRVLNDDRWEEELEKPVSSGIQLGWQYQQTTVQFEQSVKRSDINTLSPRWYFLEAKGAVSDYTDVSLVTWAKQNGKAVWAMVGNHSDLDMTHAVLSNEQYRKAAVAHLSGLVKKYDLEGLDLDFENVSPSDKTGLTAFVGSLASELHKQGAVLAVNVSPDRGTDWTEAFDYKALGSSADYIVMMGYDEHWDGDPAAGSVASLPYVDDALRLLKKQVEADKIILAMPFYTTDWTVQSGGKALASASITMQDQQAIVQQYAAKLHWDSQLGQYTAVYRKNGNTHQIWMEDGRSLSSKAAAAFSYGAAGFAYWYEGAETGDVWASLYNANVFTHYDFQ
ncbi:glycoside hydrolase [Paenibacillus protaetiae]|uniref:Glycoside hydrolase n=2 Tax=Paenibacillus protaetiae TaxID=2509456 RepID=A0A4P6EZQ7_9BACL|nr:glycoside hydrolase [Paenibacillus protaetiae]